MARKHGGKSGISGGAKTSASAAPGARIKKIERYEDTLEPGSVDDFMFKRDQISFNPQNESDEEDVNAGQGEEVLSLSRPKTTKTRSQEEEVDDDEEEEDEVAPKKKERKTKSKLDLSGKGRFAKPIVSSDEDESGSSSGSGSGDSEDERWGRSYYSRPSTRREKEKEGVDDEKREEEREMEEKEVRRLQKKAREALEGDDWGLAEVEEAPVMSASVEGDTGAVQTESIPAPPPSADPAALLRHLEKHEPVKLALARDFPLIVKKLEKTARGIKKLESPEADGELHKGLGWLHYQTLLTYASTLAYYIHLCFLSASERPEPEIPIIPRLLQLKEGVAMLEDLNFAAGSVSDGGVVLNNGFGDDDDGEELQDGKMELIKRMREADGVEWEEDANDLWDKEGLDDGELQELLRDAELEAKARKAKKGKKEKKSKKAKKVEMEADDEDEFDLDDLDFDMDEEVKPKEKKAKKVTKAKAAAESGSTVAPAYAPLAEPEFFSSTSSGGGSKAYAPAFNEDIDVLGDPSALSSADFSDKQSRKKSLAFHTSKINQTLARRAEGRASRMGGDEDIPYRDRRKARDAALRKNGPSAEGEDLEPVSAAAEKGERKRARDDLDIDDGDGDGEGGDDEADGYYELVKRRKREFKDAKEAAHEEREAERLAAIASMDDESTEGGPRGLTRAIEKNRGLTPRRSKSGRNPRVKKRQAYEKAKKKVASQKSVYKGGQAALGGSYAGEKTGITKVVKSRKF